jgi:hypothetical protein
MDSVLGRWRWRDVRQQHQAVYDYLLAQQPFCDAKNQWLGVVDDLAIASKHIDLIPQIKHNERRITVSRAGVSVSYNPDAIRIGGPPGSVRFAGAVVDPTTNRVVPTQGVTERIEQWVSFVIEGHGVNAAWLCKEGCAGARRIATEMSERFRL